MSDEYACTEVDALAAELALGVLAGPERAAALAHVERCPSCAANVDELARAGDRLLSLAPGSEPPEGFETRVLARMGHAEAPAARRPRRWLAIAAAALLVVVGGAVGAGLASRGETGEAVLEAGMWTPSGERVGEVYLHEGEPAWVFVSVPRWEPPEGGSSRSYDLRFELEDGKTVVVPGLVLDGGMGAWGTNVDIEIATVRTLALVDPRGRVWCEATIST